MAISMSKFRGGLLKTATIATACTCIVLAGCRKTRLSKTGLPPETTGVKELAAIRIGDDISLNWTEPQKGVKKLLANGSMQTRVCRLERIEAECVEAEHPVLLVPGGAGTFTEELPASMRSGPPRVAYYSVQLLDREGRTRSANRVPVLMGAPPPLVDGLTAERTAKGVVLRWEPWSAASAAGETIIRLRRTEGYPHEATQAMRDGLVPFATRPEVELSATDRSATLTDPGIRKGTAYQYRAQRIFRIVVDGQTLEMDGQFSSEVQIDQR